MKRAFYILAITAVLIAGGYQYRVQMASAFSGIKDALFPPAPCTRPIIYSLGTIDNRFGVSREQFVNDIAQAASLWSLAAGKNLFSFDTKGGVTMNLIYDSRQAITQQEAQIKTTISQTNETAASLKAQFTTLEAAHATAQAAYQADLQSYNTAQASYNSEVQYWNSHGGAPAQQYAKLSAEKADLEGRANVLESERLSLNAQADQVNTLIHRYNALVGDINQKVNTINHDGLTGTQFEEGVYISDAAGKRINIYQFDNQTAFVRILAHELGHALGLDHDAGTTSIMNPINSGKNLSLSAQDLSELRTLCGR